MAASDDAVSRAPGQHRSPGPFWSTLLTLAVLCLIYQQVPGPVGIDSVKAWSLQYGLPIIGAGLLAHVLRTSFVAIRAQIKRSIAKIKDLANIKEIKVIRGGRGDEHHS